MPQPADSNRKSMRASTSSAALLAAVVLLTIGATPKAPSPCAVSVVGGLLWTSGADVFTIWADNPTRMPIHVTAVWVKLNTSPDTGEVPDPKNFAWVRHALSVMVPVAKRDDPPMTIDFKDAAIPPLATVDEAFECASVST